MPLRTASACALALAILSFAAPAVAADAGFPFLGPELSIGPMGYVPAQVSGNSAAFGAGEYLATWTAEPADGTNPEIFFARTRPDGTGLDGTGIQLTNSNDDYFDPVVASDGTNFLVLWDDEPYDGYVRTARALRISSDGGVLDSAPFSVSPDGTSVEEGKQLAFGAGEYLASWIGYYADGGGPQLPYAVRVRSDGTVLDSNPIGLEDAGFIREWIGGAAFDGTNFLEVWTHEDPGNAVASVVGERIAPNGTVLDPGGFVIYPGAAYDEIGTAKVVFDGTEYVVVWMDQPSALNIKAVRVKTDGTVLDSTPVTLWSTYPAGANYYDSLGGLGFDGTNFVVTWAAGNPVVAYAERFRASLTSAPTLVDSAPRQYGFTFPLEVTDSPNSALIVSAQGNEGFAGRTLEADGGFSTPIALAQVVAPQSQPAVAFGDGGYLLVWEDGRLDAPGLYGARFGRDGQLVDSTPFVIEPGSNSANPAVAFDGNDFIVAWDLLDAGNGVVAARVSPQGTVLDTNPLWLGGPVGIPAPPHLAFDGRETVAVWNTGALAAIRPDGTLEYDGGIQLANTGNAPAVAWNGQKMMLVYSRQNPPTYGDNDVFGAFLDIDSGFAPSGEFSIAGGTGEQDWPQIAAGDGGFYVAWATEPDPYSSQNYSVAGVPIAADGTVGTVHGYSSVSPAVVFAGSDFVVASAGQGTGANAYVTLSQSNENTVLNDPNAATFTPALATDGHGGILAAYTAYDDDPAVNNLRIRARFVGVGEQGSSCAASVDCGSGFCVDGVCCESACGGGTPESCQACSAASGASADGTCTPLTGNSCGPGGICQSGSCVSLSTSGETGSGSGTSSGSGTGGTGSQSTGGSGSSGTSGTGKSGGCGCGSGNALDLFALLGIGFAIFRRRAHRLG